MGCSGDKHKHPSRRIAEKGPLFIVLQQVYASHNSPTSYLQFTYVLIFILNNTWVPFFLLLNELDAQLTIIDEDYFSYSPLQIKNIKVTINNQ